ncbi:MAG: hypothetical protein KDH15_13890 [Rhodocyclaceae bacterium]|nr:hypothetical protein [Rhodocyclaceae bacterium]
MNATTCKVDGLGFSERARSITHEAEEHLNEASERVRRARAVLRALHAGMIERWSRLDGVDADEASDAECLVDLALELLPHHYDGEINAIEGELRQIYQLDRDREAREGLLAELLEAMTLASLPDTPIEHLQKVASRVYAIATEHAEFAGRFEDLRAALQRRGLVVEVQIIQGVDLGPAVMTPERAKATKRIAKRSERFVRSVRRELAQVGEGGGDA